MEILINVAIVLLGGIVLFFGAEWLVDGAAGLARKLGINEMVIGLTIVAYGTSAPELAVSISANLGGTPPLLFGNVIGSCIANMGLILGLTALVSPPRIEPGLLRRDLPILFISAAILPLMLWSGSISRWEAAILLSASFLYSALTFWSARYGSPTLNVADPDDDHEESSTPTARLLVLSVAGLLSLIGGGELFVTGAKGIAVVLGMSERVVGLTVVAFGTSVPELAASLMAATRGHAGLAIGNIIGSNIFNIFLVVGTSASIRPLLGDLSSQTPDFGFLMGVTLFGMFVMRKARNISRFEGAILITIYIAFITISTVYTHTL